MPTYTLTDLWGHAFTKQSDFLTLKSRWATVVSESAAYSDDDFDTLDADSTGTLDQEDLDYHLDRLAKQWLAPATRLPSDWDNQDDPLELAGTNVILIDPSNALAVNVTAGSNNCTLASDGSSTGSLFDGSAYAAANRVWYDLKSLNEQGNSTISRFHATAGTVRIYVRGGAQTIDKEIYTVLQSGAGAQQTRIVVRNYPGEVPTIYMGSAAYTSTSAAFGKYTKDTMWSCLRQNFRIWGLNFIGHRDSGFGNIYAPELLSAGPPGHGYWLKGCSIVDHLGIPSSNSNASRLPHLVDPTYLIRSASNGTLYTAAQVGQSHTITLSGLTSGKIEDCYIRPGSFDFPYVHEGDDDVFNGEGLDLTTCSGITVQRNRMEGIVAHGMFRTTNCYDITIEHNDISNLAHSCLLVLGNDGSTGGSDHTIRYNRIHNYEQLLEDQANGMQLQGMSDSTVSYNVVYNDGVETEFSAGIALTGVISGGANDTQGNAIHHNVLYKTGIALEYTGTKSGAPSANDIYDNEISYNLIIDFPVGNVGETYYGAPVRVGLDAPLSNTSYGNTIHDNYLTNSYNADEILKVTTTAGAIGPYDIDNTDFPGYTNNATADPLFYDSANGDFRMANATLAAVFAGAPLVGPQPDGGTQEKRPVLDIQVSLRDPTDDANSLRASVVVDPGLRHEVSVSVSLRDDPPATSLARV